MPFLFFHPHFLFHRTRSLAFSRDVEPWIAENRSVTSLLPLPLLPWNVKRHRDRERKKVSSNLGHGEEIIVGMISAVFPAEITTRCGIRFARSSMMINSWNLSVFRWTPLLCPREYNEYKGNPRGFVFDEGSSLSSVPFFVELESYIGLFLWKRWRMDSLFLRDRIWSTC